jgi:ABC-type multidrug transport system ATPase subunit
VTTETNTHRKRASALAIEATGLVKEFDTVRAVDGVDLAVRSGSVYGVLGPNGAGKTTTIRMLATLLRPGGARRACSATTSWPRPMRCAASSA